MVDTERAGVTLFIGTRKGLFIAVSDRERRGWQVEGPYLAGYEIYHAVPDVRSPGTTYAAAHHPVWGVHIHRSRDGGRTWEVLPEVPHHTGEDGDSLRAIWYIAPGHASQPDVLFAGIEPAGLFVSRDEAATWQPIDALNDHPTRETWQPARGGLILHSIYVDPRSATRIFVAVSAGGVYRSVDGGASWEPTNSGVRADYLPNRMPSSGHCEHRLIMHPSQPDRLYRQSHTGTYRTDDGGDNWREITKGLPSDFGYAVASDVHDPDTVYVIPEESSHMRTTVGGAITVYRSGDAGETWEPLTRGLPQANAYVTVLREAIDTDSLESCGAYFGTSSGHLFASRDRGDSWELIAGYLPKILSVKAALAGST